MSSENNTLVSANEALGKLRQGNEKYLDASVNSGDISLAIRKDTCENGQHPYAIVITCADSRVIPESIFSAGIGELFVIRVAGNVINEFQLGSVEYAADHLGSKLVVVLGHTNCGAVGAAVSGHTGGFIKSITDEIKAAIGEETDGYKACCLNVRHGVEKIESSLEIPAGGEKNGVRVIGAVYHIEDGRVEFMEA
ncbi:MAG: carbonic anhydrase [Blautia sp.]|nr:carbonic anhydrase [Blautia sp.]